MKTSDRPITYFVGGLRRPLRVGSYTLTWPLVGLYVFDNRLEFGAGLKFMRRLTRTIKTFSADEVALVGPTDRGVRFTFTNGERWIFGWCDIAAVMNAMAELGIPTTSEVVPANWWPPL